jgi:DHA1 family bicyclomycin/chloramphenicol resistance-like MFS transporter
MNAIVPSGSRLLWLIAGYLMLQPLSTDLYLASLPHLSGTFGVPAAQAQQTLTLFVAGFAVAQLLAGPLSDRFGRRPVLLGGFALYTAASVVCMLTPSMPVLLAARVVQAVGCCTVVVNARALVRDLYDPAEGARVIAQASSLLAIAPIVGPIAGGYLQEAFGFRAAFGVLTAYALLLGAATWRLMPETNRRLNPDATRPAGLLRIYLGLLRTPAFWSYALPGALSYGAIFVFISGSSFILIDVLGVPTFAYGWCFAVGVLGYLGGTLLCRRLLLTRGMAATLALGSRVSAAAGVGFLVAVLAGWHHWSMMVLALFAAMLAHGINFPCVQAGAVAPFPASAGAAAALFGFLAMAAALLSGTWVGANLEGGLVPVAAISAATGCAVMASAWLLRRHRQGAMPSPRPAS